MQKTYDAQSIEAHWGPYWEQQNHYQAQSSDTTFSMVLPPPNVTGSLHMGHGFQMTLMDILSRYHRMCGDNTLWQPGTDHAGIATQMVVERRLAAEGKSRAELGREAFVQQVWKWREQSGGNITQQMRRLGVSVDWSRECFSLDPHISEAVYTTFDKLYHDKLLYRGYKLVNWDPQLQTAISDLEVINKPHNGKLWHIRYPLADSDQYLVVATTRPETLFGDVAVAVHPDDTRYQALIGQQLQLPLCDRLIPIIADPMVDQTFGSGCVKITPAHDFNDYEVGQRHQLKPLNIMDKRGHLNQHVPADYQGLERFAARKQAINALQALELIEKIEPHQQNLPYGDRSDCIIEPLLTQQWFVHMQPMAEKAIAALENQELRFYPDNWKNTYLHWLNNIQDWCISRQLWWGHRIPVWYDSEDNMYLGRDIEEVKQRYALDPETTLTQDPDVLDTWFSAALWPFATLGWPQQDDIFNTFYPTQTLITGFDIIFFWVARMVMLGYYCTGKCPFKQVYITGLIRDQQGQKMSKSKGNVLDPIDLIDGIDLQSLINKRTANMMQPELAEKISKQTRKQFPQGIPSFGTDALRFTFCALASTGRDINFDLERITGYRNFCNKLWNAARYVLMQTETNTISISKNLQPQHFTIAEHWIMHNLQQTTIKAEQHIAQYRFDLLAQLLYDFVWNQYCDWYLELNKVNLQTQQNNTKISEQSLHVLVYVLEHCLRLLHPIIPFITEEIWQSVATLYGFEKNSSIMLQPYPKANLVADPTEVNQMQLIQAVINAVRSMRSEMNLKPKQRVDLLCQASTPSIQKIIDTHQYFITHLAKVDTLQYIEQDQQPTNACSVVLSELTVYMPLDKLIDPQQETQRITKNLLALEKDLARCQQKLHNENYVKKAPADVVAAEQQKLKELQHKQQQLQLQLDMLKNK